MGDEHEIDPATRAKSFVNAIRFSGELGMQLDMIGGGKAHSMPHNESFVYDSATGDLRGEAILRFMDPDSRARLTKTISFSIDNPRHGPAQESYALTTGIRTGRSYASAHVDIWQTSGLGCLRKRTAIS